MSDLIYIEKIPANEQPIFKSVLYAICNQLEIADPNWLMQVFYAESRVNPRALNATTKAAGLIQFMPQTAAALGTSTDALLKMTATQQLDFVQKYFKPYKGRVKSYFDAYLVVFFPAAIGRPDDWVMQTTKLSPEIIAKQNPAINIIKDGKITVAEFKQYVKKTVPVNWQNIFFPILNTAQNVAAAVADNVVKKKI